MTIKNSMNNEDQSSISVSTQLTVLREALIQGRQGTESADLIAQLTHESVPFDDILIGQIAARYMAGENIEAAYPEFYKQLIRDKILFDQFFDLIEALNARPSASLPITPFSPKPHHRLFSNHSQSFSWFVLAEHLNHLLNLSLLARSPAIRFSQDNSLARFTLLRDRIWIGEHKVSIRMTGQLENGDVLQIMLLLAIQTDFFMENIPLKIQIKWGDGQSTLELTRAGDYTFSSITLRSVCDENYVNIVESLSLELVVPSEYQARATGNP